MAVIVTQLDGQNVGLRLLGQTTITALTLDLTTGAVTSDYIPQASWETLQKFALRLFEIVPRSARSASAAGMMSRICAISPADSCSITLEACVSGGVAELEATVDASPASIILTIPHTVTGGVVPGAAPSGGGGGGGDSGVTQVLAGEPLEVGQPVAISGGLAVLARADDAARLPCVGIVEGVIDSVTVKVRVAGIAHCLSGLTEGRIYFLSATGELLDNPPVISGQTVQALGFSISSSTFAVAPSTALSVR